MDIEKFVGLATGPFGALVVLAFVLWKGSKYFDKLLARFDDQAKRFDELHASTLNHINAQTEATRSLHQEIKECPLHDRRGEGRATETSISKIKQVLGG